MPKPTFAEIAAGWIAGSEAVKNDEALLSFRRDHFVAVLELAKSAPRTDELDEAITAAEAVSLGASVVELEAGVLKAISAACVVALKAKADNAAASPKPSPKPSPASPAPLEA
jgi:hypothetical protein